MPIDSATKTTLRDKVSLANKSNVAEVIAEVEKAKASLPADDRDHKRIDTWLADLRSIEAGGVMGKS